MTSKACDGRHVHPLLLVQSVEVLSRDMWEAKVRGKYQKRAHLIRRLGDAVPSRAMASSGYQRKVQPTNAGNQCRNSDVICVPPFMRLELPFVLATGGTWQHLLPG